MNMTDNKNRILSILRATGRPGVDAVINYLESSSYFKRGCYSHHKERGGLAQHSIEVYDYMVSHAGSLPADSIAVAALFHDLGKTRWSDGRGHGVRSLDILSECGFELTEAERIAIGKHHSKSVDFITNPLRRVLSMGDCRSTGAWKAANSYKSHHRRHRHHSSV